MKFVISIFVVIFSHFCFATTDGILFNCKHDKRDFLSAVLPIDQNKRFFIRYGNAHNISPENSLTLLNQVAVEYVQEKGFELDNQFGANRLVVDSSLWQISADLNSRYISIIGSISNILTFSGQLVIREVYLSSIPGTFLKTVNEVTQVSGTFDAVFTSIDMDSTDQMSDVVLKCTFNYIK